MSVKIRISIDGKKFEKFSDFRDFIDEGLNLLINKQTVDDDGYWEMEEESLSFFLIKFGHQVDNVEYL